jgi:hypothetical protein
MRKYKAHAHGDGKLAGKAQFPSCHPERTNIPVRMFVSRTFKNLQQIADF